VEYQQVSKKPLFISEYGIDSFNDKTVAYDQALQVIETRKQNA
jgi:hypothetical protein